MAVESDLAEAVEATIRDAAESSQWKDRRARAIHRLHDEDGLSTRQISQMLRDELVRRGVAEADLKGMGVTPHNVRKILEKPPPA